MSKKIKVRKVRDLGPQFVDNTYRMVGQDGAYSIPLGDTTLWFFGDTLIGNRTPSKSLWYIDEESIKFQALTEGWNLIEKIVHNTGALVKNKIGAKGLDNYSHLMEDGKSLKQIIPLMDGENQDSERIWCFHGCEISDRLYLFFQKIEIIEDEDSPFPVAFRVIGSGLAAGNKRDWEFKRVWDDNFGIAWKVDQPQFGAVVLSVADDDYLYIYGVLRDSVTSTQNVYVARVQPAKIEDISCYEYLSNLTPEWSKKVTEAIPIFTGPPNELSISFNRYLNCYLAVHSQDISGTIMGRTSHNPWGPWSEATELYKVKLPTKKIPYPTLIYAGKEHPELSPDGGKTLYITYVEFEEYFPHLIEVELD